MPLVRVEPRTLQTMGQRFNHWTKLVRAPQHFIRKISSIHNYTDHPYTHVSGLSRRGSRLWLQTGETEMGMNTFHGIMRQTLYFGAVGLTSLIKKTMVFGLWRISLGLPRGLVMLNYNKCLQKVIVYSSKTHSFKNTLFYLILFPSWVNFCLGLFIFSRNWRLLMFL